MERAIDGGEADFLVTVEKRLVNVLGRDELIETAQDLNDGGALAGIASAEFGNTVVDGHVA